MTQVLEEHVTPSRPEYTQLGDVSPASSARAHGMTGASRALFAWSDVMPGRPQHEQRVQALAVQAPPTMTRFDRVRTRRAYVAAHEHGTTLSRVPP